MTRTEPNPRPHASRLAPFVGSVLGLVTVVIAAVVLFDAPERTVPTPVEPPVQADAAPLTSVRDAEPQALPTVAPEPKLERPSFDGRQDERIPGHWDPWPHPPRRDPELDEATSVRDPVRTPLDRALQWGGGVATEDAVSRGLAWLAAHQDEDGSWDGSGFMKHDPPTDVCTGASTRTGVDPGLTSLVTLAFLGAGHTHRSGAFAPTVKKAVQYLSRTQGLDGLIGARRGPFLLGHAICTLALVEEWAMTRSPLVKSAMVTSVEYLVRARDARLAWSASQREGESDIATTGWAVMALDIAQRHSDAWSAETDRALKQAGRWIESITDDDHGATGFQTRPPRGWQGTTSAPPTADDRALVPATPYAGNHSPTAIATVCRMFLGDHETDRRLHVGASIVANAPPVWDTGGGGRPSQLDFTWWYHGTLAMFQVGGAHWERWNFAMKAALVDHQRLDGSARGTWDPIDAGGARRGRIYATAINVLTLEVYYHYGRRFREPR